jgi:hypothetical protein
MDSKYIVRIFSGRPQPAMRQAVPEIKRKARKF